MMKIDPTQTIARACLLFFCVLAMTGCDLMQSKEQQCLTSTRLEFKDPDSLVVVQNLGLRGQVALANSDFFWLRYKAKNSYGAFTSRNMACSLEGGKWVRDLGREFHSEKNLQMKYLKELESEIDARIQNRVPCKSKSCMEQLQAELRRFSEAAVDKQLAEAAERASAVVFESLESLD